MIGMNLVTSKAALLCFANRPQIVNTTTANIVAKHTLRFQENKF
jgi:hypothetical protein